jgi:hypothetical protein
LRSSPSKKTRPSALTPKEKERKEKRKRKKQPLALQKEKR